MKESKMEKCWTGKKQEMVQILRASGDERITLKEMANHNVVIVDGKVVKNRYGREEE